MPLLKLRFDVANLAAGEDAARILDGLADASPLAVTVFEAAPSAFAVEAYYEAQPPVERARRALTAAGLEQGDPALETVPDQNWVALSQAALPPVTAGRFVVHGSHDRKRAAGRRNAIEIEAGEAFGTAHNATTALCLEAVDRLARRRHFTRILDLGCGTGVLAIAAARVFPAARVLATDNDPLAVAIATANARLNRIGTRARILDAVGMAHPLLRAAAGFDLILANLLPGLLVDLAPGMRRVLRPGGIGVLSGILDHQAREVGGVYAAMGFLLVSRSRRDGWTVLTVRRRG